MKFLLFFLLLLGEDFVRLDYVAEHRIDNFNIDSRRYAIKYYDPISFYKNQPQIGLESIPFSYNGVIYTFANKENKEKFIEKFRDLEPRFGGWCAFSMTEGKKVDFKPEFYSVIRDSLYLFSSKEKMELFKADYEHLQKLAWSNWERILPTFNPKDSAFRIK